MQFWITLWEWWAGHNAVWLHKLIAKEGITFLYLMLHSVLPGFGTLFLIDGGLSQAYHELPDMLFKYWAVSSRIAPEEK